MEIARKLNMLILRVTNPVDLKKFKPNVLLNKNPSTKSNHEGLGLKAVKRIVNFYEGSLAIELEDNVVSFVVRIPVTGVQGIDCF